MPRPFPGVGPYLDAAAAELPDPGQARAAMNDVALVHQIADLVGQAFAARPEHAAGIFAAAESLDGRLQAAAKAGAAVIEHARRELGLAPARKPRGPKVPDPIDVPC